MAELTLTIPPPAKSVAQQQLPTLQGLNILVVEDQEDMLELIATILEQAGAEVTAVSSAVAALETLQAQPYAYDLLLSDLVMPQTDGWSLIRQVRALTPECGGKIPAVALTAYNSKKDRNISLFFGFDMLLSKPIEPAHLVLDIAKLMRNRRRRYDT
jgi:two-component system, chemotaxis family, CheB/CheR fusion protein